MINYEISKHPINTKTKDPLNPVFGLLYFRLWDFKMGVIFLPLCNWTHKLCHAFGFMEEMLSIEIRVNFSQKD
jgi:hypothetical protein